MVLPTSNSQLPTKVYFAADHAGFVLKNQLLEFVRDELEYEVQDFGAKSHMPSDDYPDIIFPAARAVASDKTARGIFLGASGQGEAIAANRVRKVRAVVFYGNVERSQKDAGGRELDLLSSSREHNNANVLCLGARFLDSDEAKDAVRIWLQANFSEEERHVRRIEKLDTVYK